MQPITWVVGAGGLVGRHVARRLEQAGHEVLVTAVPWHDEAASVLALVDAVDVFTAARAGRAWSVVWCAGAEAWMALPTCRASSPTAPKTCV